MLLVNQLCIIYNPFNKIILIFIEQTKDSTLNIILQIEFTDLSKLKLFMPRIVSLFFCFFDF